MNTVVSSHLTPFYRLNIYSLSIDQQFVAHPYLIFVLFRLLAQCYILNELNVPLNGYFYYFNSRLKIYLFFNFDIFILH